MHIPERWGVGTESRKNGTPWESCVFLADTDRSAGYICVILVIANSNTKCDEVGPRYNESQLPVNSIRLAMGSGHFLVCVLALALDHHPLSIRLWVWGIKVKISMNRLLNEFGKAAATDVQKRSD